MLDFVYIILKIYKRMFIIFVQCVRYTNYHIMCKLQKFFKQWIEKCQKLLESWDALPVAAIKTAGLSR